MTAPRQHIAIPGATAPVFYSTVYGGGAFNRSPEMAPAVTQIEVIARFEVTP